MLLLHCGATKVAREELQQVVTPRNQGRWFPTPHHDVLCAVEETLEASGYQVKNQQLALAKEGSRFFGVLDLTTSVGDTESLTVGIRNSHDKTFSMGFCVGVRTFICDNLAFSADIVLAKKHTRFGDSRYRDGIVGAVQNLSVRKKQKA